MRTDDVDKAHEEALEEGFDWEVAREINRLGRANAGERVLLPEVLARAAFWLRVYGELTDNDPVAALVMVGLCRKLKVGLLDMRKAN